MGGVKIHVDSNAARERSRPAKSGEGALPGYRYAFEAPNRLGACLYGSFSTALLDPAKLCVCLRYNSSVGGAKDL